MAKVGKMSADRYQGFISAFLELGPNYSAVGRRMGCAQNTARKAWEVGWPEYSWRAVRDVYAEKAPPENAVLATVASKVSMLPDTSPDLATLPRRSQSDPLDIVEKVKDQAYIALGDESDLLASFRSTVLGALQGLNSMTAGFVALSDTASKLLQIQAKDPLKVKPARVAELGDRISKAMLTLATTLEKVMSSQRLLVGAPQEISETRNTTPGDRSERVANLGAAIQLLQRTGTIDAKVTPVDAPYAGEESGDPTP